MRRNIIIYNVILLIALVGYHSITGKIIQEKEAESLELSKTVDSLTGEVFNKNNQLLEQQEEIDTYMSKMESLEGDIELLEKENNDLGNKVEEYKDKIESHPHTISSSKSSSNASSKSSSGKTLSVKATHYTAFCSTGCTGVTRTGYDVSSTIKYNGMRIIATDPKVIPLHSIVRVDTGSKTFKAISLDTGGAIKGHKIDILVASKSEARKLGVKNADVKVIRKGK